MPTTLTEGDGNLYRCEDPDVDFTFDALTADDDDVRLQLLDAGGDAPSFRMVVANDDERFLEEELHSNFNLRYSEEERSVLWWSLIDGQQTLVAFRFGGADALRNFNAFIDSYNACIYALLSGVPLPVAAAEDDAQYLSGLGTQPVPARDEPEDDTPVYEFEEDGIAAATTTGLRVTNHATAPEGENVCFADAALFNRALVVKQPAHPAAAAAADPGVFLQAHVRTRDGFDNDAGEMVFVPTADPTTEGSLLDHSQRRLFLFGNERHMMQTVDLERGTVVQEYDPERMDGAGVPINSVTYASQRPTEHNALLTVLSDSVAFNIDTRLDPRRCVVTETGKTVADYAIKLPPRQSFTAHATSANGHLAIGDSSGKLRLYVGPPGGRREVPLRSGSTHYPKTAKTLLELRMPILCVDISPDGHYILATTRRFVLFIDTHYVDGGAEVDGFETRMGQNKPQPLRLQPAARAIAGTLGGPENVAFTEAHFSNYVTGGGARAANDCFVVATCGAHILTWSLATILAAGERQRGGTVESQAVMPVRQSVVAAAPAAQEQLTVNYLTNDTIGSVPLRETEQPRRRWGEWNWGGNQRQ